MQPLCVKSHAVGSPLEIQFLGLRREYSQISVANAGKVRTPETEGRGAAKITLFGFLLWEIYFSQV